MTTIKWGFYDFATVYPRFVVEAQYQKFELKFVIFFFFLAETSHLFLFYLTASTM